MPNKRSEDKPTGGTLISTSSCSCRVIGFNDKIGWHVEIAYCPLHASAAELVEALNDQIQFLFSKGFETEARELRCKLRRAKEIVSETPTRRGR